jgi:hypothetical protein
MLTQPNRRSNITLPHPQITEGNKQTILQVQPIIGENNLHIQRLHRITLIQHNRRNSIDQIRLQIIEGSRLHIRLNLLSNVQQTRLVIIIDKRNLLSNIMLNLLNNHETQISRITTGRRRNQRKEGELKI